MALVLAGQDEFVTGFHQLFHGWFGREQRVGDEDPSLAATLGADSQQQPLESALLAVLVGVAIFLDDRLYGDEQDLLHVRMRRHCAQNSMSIPSFAIALNALQAIVAMHLGGRVKADAVQHHRQEIVEIRSRACWRCM